MLLCCLREGHSLTCRRSHARYEPRRGELHRSPEEELSRNLSDAAATGDTSRCRELLDSGADPKYRDPRHHGTTALHRSPIPRACTSSCPCDRTHLLIHS